MIGLAAESFAEGLPSCAGPQSLREALVSGVQRLKRAGIETARLDAEVLLGHVLALAREQILASRGYVYWNARNSNAIRRCCKYGWRVCRSPTSPDGRNFGRWISK